MLPIWCADTACTLLRSISSKTKKDLKPLLLNSVIPSFISVGSLLSFFTYLAIAGSILPGKIVPGVNLADGTRLHYRCNRLPLLLVLIVLLGIGTQLDIVSPTAIADRGLDVL